MSDSDTRQQATVILDQIAFTPFDRCQPMSRDSEEVPPRPGLYAFRHRELGLLYISKSKNLRDRLQRASDERLSQVLMRSWGLRSRRYSCEQSRGNGQSRSS